MVHHSCLAQPGRNVQRVLKKGKKVYIEGRLTQRKYTDREGIQRVAVEVIANDMEMLSPKQLGYRRSQ